MCRNTKLKQNDYTCKNREKIKAFTGFECWLITQMLNFELFFIALITVIQLHCLLQSMMMCTLMSRLANAKVHEDKSVWKVFFCKLVFNLSNSWHICLCVNVCIWTFPPPDLVLAHAISCSRDRKRNVSTWQTKCFVVVLGRTYNYSNECIQKQHISWN